MPGENQERFEDYLELERYIEEVQAGHAPSPPSDLAPTYVGSYRMVVLFRAASLEEVEPRTEFRIALQMRLEQECRKRSKRRSPSFLSKKGHRVSRRRLLSGGTIAATFMVVGAASAWIAERIGNHTAPQTRTSTSLQVDASYISPQEDVPTVWYRVTTLALLDQKPQPFITETIVGYAVREDGDNVNPEKGEIIALSAACTHMGCFVQWQNSDHKFHCPCHGGLFTENGQVDKHSNLVPYLSPLLRLETKVEDGNVYVKVPE